jgi:hypothetical protein
MVAGPHSDRPSLFPTLVAVYAAGWVGGVAGLGRGGRAGDAARAHPTTDDRSRGHDARILALGLSAAFGAAALPLLFESFTGFSVSYVGAFVALGVANAAAYTVDFFLGMGSLNILLSPATVLWLFVAAELAGAHGSRSVSARHS